MIFNVFTHKLVISFCGITQLALINTKLINRTHHSKIVIHGLEGAAEQLAGFWVSDLSYAPTVLRVPDAQSPI